MFAASTAAVNAPTLITIKRSSHFRALWVSSAGASRAASCVGWRIRNVAARLEWRMS